MYPTCLLFRDNIGVFGIAPPTITSIGTETNSPNPDIVKFPLVGIQKHSEGVTVITNRALAATKAIRSEFIEKPRAEQTRDVLPHDLSDVVGMAYFIQK